MEVVSDLTGKRVCNAKGLLQDLLIPSFAESPIGRKPSMKKLSLILLSLALVACVRADEIGEVSTAFILIGANHKVVVEAYDDPKVNGVTCYVSRAKTGGVKGAIGLAEDKSEASIACRQVGPISFKGRSLPPQEEMFSERISVLFKKLRVVRMVDRKRNVLVYLTYSDRLIDGSPQNSVTAVPMGEVVFPRS